MSRSILRLSIFPLAILAALGVWIAIGRGPNRAAASHSSDMQAIQKLHQQDIDATLARDPQALADLFTDDGFCSNPVARP